MGTKPSYGREAVKLEQIICLLKQKEKDIKTWIRLSPAFLIYSLFATQMTSSNIIQQVLNCSFLKINHCSLGNRELGNDKGGFQSS